MEDSASSSQGSSRKNPFREIDVRYYDIGEGLPQQYVQIINLKVKDMKDQYEKTLNMLADANEEMNRRVLLLDKVNGKLILAFTIYL